MPNSKLTLLIDGNWLLMSRLSVLQTRYSDDDKLCQDLKLMMVRSINIVLKQFSEIDNIIFVSDGGSWRNKLELPSFLNEEYKGTRIKSEDINWDLVFSAYENLQTKLRMSGINVCKEANLEGDDWMWYWSNKLNSEGTNVIIWSKDKDLTQLESTTEKLNDSVTNIEQAIQGNAWIILGKATYGGEVTIPAVGWVEENGLYILEIENTQITESTIPIVAISPESYSIALGCGLKSYCRTFKGKMKLYADQPPVVEMIASLGLIGENTTAGRGLQVNPISGAIGIDSDVVVVNNDVVDEDEMNQDINNWLNS